jgi:hypothetical protein
MPSEVTELLAIDGSNRHVWQLFNGHLYIVTVTSLIIVLINRLPSPEGGREVEVVELM